MQFGHFDDAKKEYVITSPKTPLPWINYLGSENFFSLISNTCGGYSFYKDAKLLRLTRYRYNDTPLRSERTLLLHQGRRYRLEPGLAADPDAARFLRVPSWPWLQPL